MSDPVKGIFTDTDARRQEVVRLLKKYLALAEEGKIDGIVLAAELEEDSIVTAFNVHDAFRALGALHVVIARITLAKVAGEFPESDY